MWHPQAVSSRPDVTPPDYLRELEKLQDQIPAFDSGEAMQVMQQELGLPPSQLFSTLATAPAAAASLGQVSLTCYLELSYHHHHHYHYHVASHPHLMLSYAFIHFAQHLAMTSLSCSVSRVSCFHHKLTSSLLIIFYITSHNIFFYCTLTPHPELLSGCLLGMVLLTSPCLMVVIGLVVQVYKGVLRQGNKPVAVKVQRPGVRESIALDIYILRWLAGE